jgi:hypothetical protein
MKRNYLFLLILFTLMLPCIAHTQGKVTAIDSLSIDLWPDYDQTSALVLLTGALPANTKLPATVTLPFPEKAQLNAVARIDSSDGVMKDDILSSLAPGKLTFTTPDLSFRVEYYLPYAVNNKRRAFSFTWLADVPVNSLTLRVQKPLSASSLITEPATTNVFRGEDGFTYHTFPVKAVPAGQPFSVQVDYTMATAQLSAENLSTHGTRVQGSGVNSSLNTKAGTNWSIVAAVVGSIIIVILFVWQIATRRGRANPPRAHHAKAKSQYPSKFCPNCGNPTGKDDRFCSNCGTALHGE